jgi:CRP-like cAMP-binding protein
MSDKKDLYTADYAKGQYVILEGQKADCFYLIRKGKALVQNETVGPGNFFGIASAMANHPHIETVRALTDLSILVIPVGSYEKIIKSNTALSFKVIQQLSEKMVKIDKALAEANPLARQKQESKDETESGYNLYNAGNYYFKQKDLTKAAYIFRTYLEQYPEGPYVSACNEALLKCPEQAGRQSGTGAPVIQYKQGSMVFAEGEHDNKVYFIRKGTIQISMVGSGGEHVLAVIKTGELFGEMEFLKPIPRLASAIANDDCDLYTLSVEDFDKVANSNPHLINQLTYTVAEKIWFSSKMLQNSMIRDPLARMYDALSLYLERDRVDVNTAPEYNFDFSTDTLVKMVHVPPEEEGIYISRLLSDKAISLVNGKISSHNLGFIVHKANFQRKKMQQVK